MRPVALILDATVIARILRHLGLGTRAPPAPPIELDPDHEPRYAA